MIPLADIREAARVLDGVALRTPVQGSNLLSAVAGGPVHLKCENLQRAGSFKIRGAYLRISRLGAEDRAHGVVAASAGNHAQGVALAAQLLGIRATVFMPDGAALPKVAATEGYGATVRFHGSTVDEALEAAQEFARTTGAVLIHPFDHPDIVTGQGTVGLEILEQVPDVRTVIVPVGGGGLLAGIASALAGTGVRVIGVQAAGAAAYPASLAAGAPQRLARMATMADGIAIGRPGDVPFAILHQLGVPCHTVSEEDLSRALVALAERAKLLVEPAGVAAAAALLAGLEVATPAVVVLSGGNIDPLLLVRVLRHGLVAAGRYLHLQVRVPDAPGNLARLLAALAATGANVVHVEHDRTSPDLGVEEVDIAVQVETRGTDHCSAVLAELRSQGFRILE